MTGIACVGNSWIPVIDESEEKICLGCDDLLIPYGLLISLPDNITTTTLDCIEKESLFQDLQWACGWGRYVSLSL